MGSLCSPLHIFPTPPPPVFGGLGLLGNTVSILVLNSKDMRSNCFNNILTALNITDSLHIVFAMLEVLRADFVEVYNFLPHQFFPYFHYPALRYTGRINLMFSFSTPSNM